MKRRNFWKKNGNFGKIRRKLVKKEEFKEKVEEFM